MTDKKPVPWSRLENAAKIFPPISNRRDTKVFRFACQLTQEVEPAFLQQALDLTLVEFPFYRSIMKKGLFWYYLEASDRPAPVTQEDTSPCEPLYDGDRKNLLFRVTYYRCRINLEVYHAISDGTGALNFLRALTCHYLVLCHAAELEAPLPVMDYDASREEKLDDSFRKFYDKDSAIPYHEKAPAAFHYSGERLPECRLGVIEGCLSVKATLAKAKEWNTTLTAFLTGLFIQAIHQEMSLAEEKRPVVISVPVNLRNYYPSASARNFFCTIDVRVDFSKEKYDLAGIVNQVTQTFRRELTQERMAARMNRFCALEHNMLVRAIPLPLKDMIMRAANFRAEREITGSFSNVGRVGMPQSLHPYIRRFDVFASTRRLQICMCSFDEDMVITMTAPFVSTDVQRRFFRSLTEMGLAVEITTNRQDDE